MDRVTLRPFHPATDYEAIEAVMKAAEPDYPSRFDTPQERDSTRPVNFRHARYVAVANGEIIGCGEFDQYRQPGLSHPHRFSLMIYVRPDWQRQGVGSALYDRLLGDLEPLRPEVLRSYASESRPQAIRFLEKRGHVEVMRDGSAILDITTLDIEPFREAEAELAAQGIRIASLADLAGDPERNAKMHDLFEEVMQDVPPVGERTPISLEQFVQSHLEDSAVLLDGYFVGVAPDGTYIGVSEVRRSRNRQADTRGIGLTGVRRAYRRRGIAYALKGRGLRYAKEQGVARVHTWNASGNDPILALNERLGFVREPWRLHLLRTFG